MDFKSTTHAIALAGISLIAMNSAEAAQMKQTFAYDAAGRLTAVTTDATGANAAQASLDERYVYDASGNITEKQVDGQTVRMTYDAANQLMSRSDASGTVHYVYDSAGRLVAERKDGQVSAQYEYGYLDKVTRVTRGDQVTEFHYNARGMLVAKERNGQVVETFGWDGIGLIARDDTVYANEAHISGGVPLAAVDAGSEDAELQYFDSDYLGTTSAVYSAEGAVDSSLATSFGAGTESDELRFTGKPYDADLDAHVFPYRNYKADAGNWASADPAGFPDGPNQHYYACVPTVGVDPLGLAKRITLTREINWTQWDGHTAQIVAVSGILTASALVSEFHEPVSITDYRVTLTGNPDSTNGLTDSAHTGWYRTEVELLKIDRGLQLSSNFSLAGVEFLHHEYKVDLNVSEENITQDDNISWTSTLTHALDSQIFTFATATEI